MTEATFFCGYAFAVFFATATSAAFIILGVLMLVPSVAFGNMTGGIVFVVLGGTGVAAFGGGVVGGLFGAALGSPIDCCCDNI
jgi:glutamate synthase domain-containing protein 3